MDLSKDGERNKIATNRPKFRQAGLEYLQRGQWREATECFSRLAEWLPDDQEVASLLAEATFKLSLEEQQSRHRRKRVVRRALMGPLILLAVFAFLLLLGKSYQYSLNQAEARRRQQEETQTAQSLERARQHLMAGQYAQAQQLYEHLLGQYPDHEEAQMGLAEAQRQAQLASLYSQALAAESQGQSVQALDRWRALEELNPGYRDVAQRLARLERSKALTTLFERAERSYQEQQWQQAIHFYQELQREALQFEMEEVSAHLFQCYLNGGLELLAGQKGALHATDVSQAQNLFAQALVLRPREPRAVAGLELGQLLTQSRTKCGEEQSCFLAVLEEKHQKGENNGKDMLAALMARMHVSLARGLEAGGNPQLALEHYNRALQLEVGGREGTLAQEGRSRLIAGFTPTPTPTPIPTITPTPTPAGTPTSTETPTPSGTPTPTPTPTPIPLPKAQVNTALLNLRAGPGTGYRIMAALPKGSPVAVSGIDPSGSWVKASTDVGEGWLHISYLTFPGGRPKLPVVAGE